MEKGNEMINAAAARCIGTTINCADIAGFGNTFVELVLAGDRAFLEGRSKSSNPYDPETEDHDSWNYGWEGLAYD